MCVCCVVREYVDNRRAGPTGRAQPAVLHMGHPLISRIAVSSSLLLSPRALLFPVSCPSRALLFPVSSPLQSFIAEEKPEWEVKGDRIYFDLSTAKKVEVPSLRLIKETLTYANELDRIV